MPAFRALFLLLYLTGLTIAGARAEGMPPSLVESNGAFACDLFEAVRGREGNLFLSPYSISVALAMVRAGGGGETLSQMDAVLHLSREDAAQGHRDLARRLEPPLVPESGQQEAQPIPAYQLSIANALWGQEGLAFREPFLAALEDDYGAPLARVDFGKPGEARDRINAWVEAQTKSRIREIIPEGEPPPDARLALANAIYLKASWENPFKAGRTAEAPFTTSGGVEVTARYMRQTETLRYAGTDEVQVLSLPYRDGRLSMVILLPRRSDDLQALEARLRPEQLARWLSSLRPVHVHVALPRFEFEDSFDLTGTLAEMGMPDAFDPERADFSEMSEVRLFISLVLHRAFVSVDEEGTEAAAATAVSMTRAGVPSEPAVEFQADHPFLFFIQHGETGAILFLGRFADPKGSLTPRPGEPSAPRPAPGP
jgi:serpin B